MAWQWRRCSWALTQRRSEELEKRRLHRMCVSVWGAGSAARGHAEMRRLPTCWRPRHRTVAPGVRCAGKARPPLVLSAALLPAAPKAPAGWLAASCCRRAGQSCTPAVCRDVVFLVFFMGDGEGDRHTRVLGLFFFRVFLAWGHGHLHLLGSQ
jgi:hypothetical protein